MDIVQKYAFLTKKYFGIQTHDLFYKNYRVTKGGGA